MSRAAFELACELPNHPDEVWAAVEKPALFLHVAAPLVAFEPIGLDCFPDHWEEREYRGSMRLFGLIPLGWQAIVISFPPPQGPMRILHDSGCSPLLPEWSHRIEVSPSAGGTRYCDRIEFDSRVPTVLAKSLLRLFFSHRQRRLRQLAKTDFATLRT